MQDRSVTLGNPMTYTWCPFQKVAVKNISRKSHRCRAVKPRTVQKIQCHIFVSPKHARIWLSGLGSVKEWRFIDVSVHIILHSKGKKGLIPCSVSTYLRTSAKAPGLGCPLSCVHVWCPYKAADPAFVMLAAQWISYVPSAVTVHLCS